MRRNRPALGHNDGPLVSSHLVVKRGHRGRFRFMMIHAGERIGGEVWVDARVGSPHVLHALALAKIARLAGTLQAGIGARVASDQSSSGKSFEIDEANAWLHTGCSAGDQYGAVRKGS